MLFMGKHILPLKLYVMNDKYNNILLKFEFILYKCIKSPKCPRVYGEFFELLGILLTATISFRIIFKGRSCTSFPRKLKIQIY